MNTVFGFRILYRHVAVIGLLMMVGCDRGGAGYPSDADQTAINFFVDHQGDFEKLRLLIEAHPFMILNAERKESLPENAFVGAPDAKVEMLGLMSELKLLWVNGVESDCGVRLTFLASGMAMGSTTKSFHYNKVQPKNLVPSTDHFAPNTTDSSSVFRSIAPNWYLQVEWGG